MLYVGIVVAVLLVALVVWVRSDLKRRRAELVKLRAELARRERELEIAR